MHDLENSYFASVVIDR